MDRRTFIGAVAGGFVAAPFAAYAQPAEKVYRIGLLRVGVGTTPLSKSFWETMARLGWVEGQNVIVERRPASRADLLPGLAADLVQLKVDLIITNGTPATSAAKKATTTIPIVFRVGDDPVENGLVSSLARPGGNLTGVVDGIYAGGGLLFYAPTPNYQGPVLAAQIKKILSGTKPGDLPVEQPTKFDLVINLKSAKALSLTIPPSMLARASEVIR